MDVLSPICPYMVAMVHEKDWITKCVKMHLGKNMLKYCHSSIAEHHCYDSVFAVHHVWPYCKDSAGHWSMLTRWPSVWPSCPLPTVTGHWSAATPHPTTIIMTQSHLLNLNLCGCARWLYESCTCSWGVCVEGQGKSSLRANQGIYKLKYGLTWLTSIIHRGYLGKGHNRNKDKRKT